MAVIPRISPAVLPGQVTRWNERLAWDVALLQEYATSSDTPPEPEDVKDVLVRHGIRKKDLYELSRDPGFVRAVTRHRESIREEGITFRNKARLMAEDGLTTYWQMLHDPDVPYATRNDGFKNIVKWADLEPKRDAKETGAPDSRFSITINLGEQGSSHVVADVTPALDAD